MFEVLAWLDITSYLALFSFWMALYCYKTARVCKGQNTLPHAEAKAVVANEGSMQIKHQQSEDLSYMPIGTDTDSSARCTTELLEMSTKKSEKCNIQNDEHTNCVPDTTQVHHNTQTVANVEQTEAFDENGMQESIHGTTSL